MVTVDPSNEPTKPDVGTAACVKVNGMKNPVMDKSRIANDDFLFVDFIKY